MGLVIADTGPVNYLILIGCIDLLPALFEKIIVPAAVQNELASRKAPSVIRQWIGNPPAWLEVRESPFSQAEDAALKGIDSGEKAAIQLAAFLHADLWLMDDGKGVSAAEKKGLADTGPLGILDLAAQGGRLDFALAVERLADQFQNSRSAARCPAGETSAEKRTCLNPRFPSPSPCFRIGPAGAHRRGRGSRRDPLPRILHRQHPQQEHAPGLRECRG